MLIVEDPGAESGVRQRCLNGQPFQFFDSMTAKLTKRVINPISPNSDQDQFSPNNIHTLSRDML